MKVASATPSHLFTDTVTIERKTESVDMGGSVVESWASHLTGVTCAVQPVSTRKDQVYGGERATRMHTMFTAPGQDITTKDRIVVTEDRTGGDVTRRYQVVAVQDLVTAGRVLEIDMEAVDATP
jgi:head-tail adaptor